MTERKALKKHVRTRMAKTGERYTAARAKILAKSSVEATREGQGPWATTDLGVSDARLKERTGCDWATWIYVLDFWGAREKTHTEIARHVADSYDVGGWWAQTIAVGYERARGMRAVHGRADGLAVSVSKTLPIDADALRPYLTDGRKRNRWLPPGALERRPGRSERTIRFDADAGTRVHATLDPKGPRKTTLTIEHARLASQADLERARGLWRDRLAALAEALSS